MHSRNELFLCSLECYFGIYFPRRVKHKNNPLVSAQTVRHSSTYIILYKVYIAHMERDIS